MAKRILMADDSDIFRKLQGTYLKNQPYELIFAEDGAKALERINALKPDLVILDLLMPGLEGDKICRIIKSAESLRHIPVIMISTRGDNSGQTRCLQAGCDLFISKPINRQEFLGAIRRLAPV